MQSQSVVASIKHFIANEQETNRNPSGNVSAVSSNIDDKTMHETYLWPFQDAIHAGGANIMCSYNRVNNSYGCQNSKTLNGLLKTELGFQVSLHSEVITKVSLSISRVSSLPTGVLSTEAMQ